MAKVIKLSSAFVQVQGYPRKKSEALIGFQTKNRELWVFGTYYDNILDMPANKNGDINVKFELLNGATFETFEKAFRDEFPELIEP